MNKSHTLNKPNPVAEAAMARHIEAIRRVAVDHSYAYDSDGLLTRKLNIMAEKCTMILDIGQSSRDKIKLFDQQQIETMDINVHDACTLVGQYRNALFRPSNQRIAGLRLLRLG